MDKNGGFKFPFPLHANESSVGSLLNTFPLIFFLFSQFHGRTIKTKL